MAFPIKKISVLLITATVFLGAAANALADRASVRAAVTDADMTEVRSVLIDKGKVPAAKTPDVTAEKTDRLPLLAVKVFQLAGRGAESQVITEAYNEAIQFYKNEGVIL